MFTYFPDMTLARTLPQVQVPIECIQLRNSVLIEWRVRIDSQVGTAIEFGPRRVVSFALGVLLVKRILRN